MKISTQVTINAPKETVWKTVTNIANSVDIISGIEKLEVLEEPESGLIGFKWRETRTMFGKTATEVMWVTDAKDLEYYDVRAESHGAVYLTRIRIHEANGQTVLSWDFEGKPQTFGAKMMTFLMGFMFKGATKKALQQDLEDIKAAIEGKG